MNKYILIFILCFVPRFVCLFTSLAESDSYVHNSWWKLSNDMIEYKTLGFDGQKSTSFDFLHPIFLAACKWITNDNFYLSMLLQIIVCCIGAIYLYKLGVLLTNDEKIADISVILYSFYPYFIRQSVAIIEIPLVMTLLIMSIFYFLKDSSVKTRIYCGILFGLTILARPAALPVWVFAMFILLINKHLAQTLIVFIATVLIILPFFLRNYHVNGSFFPTRSGVNFLQGTSKYTEQLHPKYHIDFLIPYVNNMLTNERPDLWKGNEKERNDFWTKKAIDFVKENPWLTIKTKLKHIIYLFYPRLVPRYENIVFEKEPVFNAEGYIEGVPKKSTMVELVYSLPYCFIFITAIIGMYIRRKELKKDLILYLTIMGYIIVYAILFHPGTRFRATMDFILMFYSACALSMIIQQLKTSKTIAAK